MSEIMVVPVVAAGGFLLFLFVWAALCGPDEWPGQPGGSASC